MAERDLGGHYIVYFRARAIFWPEAKRTCADYINEASLQ